MQVGLLYSVSSLLLLIKLTNIQDKTGKETHSELFKQQKKIVIISEKDFYYNEDSGGKYTSLSGFLPHHQRGSVWEKFDPRLCAARLQVLSLFQWQFVSCCESHTHCSGEQPLNLWWI